MACKKSYCFPQVKTKETKKETKQKKLAKIYQIKPNN